MIDSNHYNKIEILYKDPNNIDDLQKNVTLTGMDYFAEILLYVVTFLHISDPEKAEDAKVSKK